MFYIYDALLSLILKIFKMVADFCSFRCMFTKCDQNDWIVDTITKYYWRFFFNLAIYLLVLK